jgi:mannose-6-phosphate isomerase
VDPERGASRLLRYVAGDLVPAWLPRACGADGLFHERLDPTLRPLDLGYRRLLSQCRQVFSFAEAAALGAPAEALATATAAWPAIVRAFADPADGAFRFAIGAGAPLPPTTRHLYAYAFVELAVATLRRVATGEARPGGFPDLLPAIRERFARPGGGFHAAIDERGAPLPLPFAQNPHMHLFEACLFRLDLGPDPEAGAMAGTIVDLLLDRFLDPADGTLREYLDLAPADAPRAAVREVGHHYEWIWLIARWLRLAEVRAIATRRDELCEAATRLLAWSVARVLAHPEGAAPDEVAADGRVLAPTRRIWPVLEAVKAHAFAHRAGWDAPGAAEAERLLWVLLFRRHLREDTGTWTEVLEPDLRPRTTDHPGTTPYHILMAARELVGLDSARGGVGSKK